MPKSIGSLLLLSILFLSSCSEESKQEEPEPEVILAPSGDYLPMYPGSYWDYLNAEGDTVRFYTLDETELTDVCGAYSNEEPEGFDNEQYYTTSLIRYPYLNNLDNVFSYYVPRIEKWGSYPPDEYYCHSIFRENIGERWIITQVDQYTSNILVAKVIDKRPVESLYHYSTDSIIIAERRYEPNYGVPPGYEISPAYPVNYLYFAKHIGLVALGVIEEAEADSIEVLRLVDWYINK